MKINFSKKNVIITGATRGIGAALLDFFHECGATIIATGTNIDHLKILKNKSKDKNIEYVHLDFTIDDSVKKFKDYISKINSIDILINNAGVNKIESIERIKQNDWDWINNVNLKGPYLLTQSVAKIMKNQNYGKIINISSIFGVISKTKRAAYSTTKWGLIGFTKAVALDLAPYNILVNSVSPGFVDTELTRKILGESEIKKLIQSIPQKRLAEANEIAKIVGFLASSHNTYITGQNIVIDGGFTSA